MNEMEKTEMVREEGDFMEFETVDPKWITIRLKNGVVLQLKTDVISVVFSGYHDGSGTPTSFPVFNVQTNTVLRTQRMPGHFVLKGTPTAGGKENRSYQ